MQHQMHDEIRVDSVLGCRWSACFDRRRVTEDEHGHATIAGPIDARCEALFASALQPSDHPTVTMAAAAISSAIRRFGTRGCACQMAQEFGDHPDEAAQRMRWVRQLAA
jgi:hypothetical protein